MKVKTKLKPDTIRIVNNLLQEVYSMQFPTKKMERLYLSVTYELADKFAAKTKALIKNMNLLNSNKKHEITLKYYQAVVLQSFLSSCVILEANPYNKSILDQFINQLDQKLA